MFIKVAVRDLSPATLILGRIGLAALVLAVVVPAIVGTRATIAEVRAHWHWLVVVGLLNTAVPFWLLSWGETRIDSGLASIIQASVPIFNAVIAFAFFHEQRVTGRPLVGVFIGFVGVALLVGAQPRGQDPRCAGRGRDGDLLRRRRTAGAALPQRSPARGRRIRHVGRRGPFRAAGGNRPAAGVLPRLGDDRLRGCSSE